MKINFCLHLLLLIYLSELFPSESDATHKAKALKSLPHNHKAHQSHHQKAEIRDNDKNGPNLESPMPGGGFTAVELDSSYWKRETGLYYTEIARSHLVDNATKSTNFESTLPPLCNISNVFDGNWLFGSFPSTETNNNSNLDAMTNAKLKGYGSCPHTHKEISQHFSLRDQPHKYSCLDQPYQLAVFQPRTCRLLTLPQLLYYFNQVYRRDGEKLHPGIAYVGDSLSGQQYISCRCLSEMNAIPIKAEYILELFFQDVDNLLCNKDCLEQDANSPLTPAQYREKYSKNILNPCLGCRDGTLMKSSNKTFEQMLELYSNETLSLVDLPSHLWIRRIPKNVKIILMGSGSWPTLYHNLLKNSTRIIEESLHLIGHLARHLKKERPAIDIFWVDLPPLPGSFDHDDFMAKNLLAKNILTPFGIKFLNTSQALLSRKLQDPNISDRRSPLHWCNPGVYSVPSFINQVSLHLHLAGKLNSYRLETNNELMNLRSIPTRSSQANECSTR